MDVRLFYCGKTLFFVNFVLAANAAEVSTYLKYLKAAFRSRCLFGGCGPRSFIANSNSVIVKKNEFLSLARDFYEEYFKNRA